MADPFPPVLSGAFRELMADTPYPATLDDLTDYLQMAVRLEHFTLPLYLTAYWSLKPAAGSKVRAVFRSVAMEEMLHLGLVCNILAGLGATPEIATATAVPHYPDVMPGVESTAPFQLEPFSTTQVGRFLEIEQPQHGPIPDATLEAVPVFKTIGDFYDAIAAALDTLNPTFLPDRQQKLGTEWFDGQELFAIATVADAKRAIRIIKEQGEGTSDTQGVPSTPGELAHYYRFNQICKQMEYTEQPDGMWKLDPAKPLPLPPADAVYLMAPVPAGGYPDVPAAVAFDQAYSDMVRLLQVAWSTAGPNTALDDAVLQMYTLGVAAQKLMATPRNLPYGPGNYGPAFRFVAATAVVPPPPTVPTPPPVTPPTAVDFARVQQILDAAVTGEDIGAHGAFWRTQTRDAFVAHKVFGKPLLAPLLPGGKFDPNESNLVKALEGRAPFGSDVVPPPAGANLRRMPAGRPPVPQAQIDEIRAWLTAGAPA